jgi:transposase InsO family protein
MANHMRAELVNQALSMALYQRQPPAGLVMHTDRGSQYGADSYRQLLSQHGIEPRMSRKGHWWDNAVAESFFHTLKSENFLEIYEVKTGKLITVLELLSPVNKLHRQGREEYERKRGYVFRSGTKLVEIDLLRAGDSLPVIGAQMQSDYRIPVSRGPQRPRASLTAFTLRQPIPSFTLPLLPGDDEPEVTLNHLLHAWYRRARFDLHLDYTQPPGPPFAGADAVWAQELITAHDRG